MATLLVMEKFDVGTIASILSGRNVSCSQMVPTMMNLLLEDPAAREALRTAGLRRIVYGGPPIRRAVLDAALDLLPATAFVQGYGSHEAGSISLRSAERRVGQGCGSTCRSRWSPYPSKNTTH